MTIETKSKVYSTEPMTSRYLPEDFDKINRMIAMDVFGKASEKEIRNRVEQLRRQAVKYIETEGREGIPSKRIGSRRFYYLEYFTAPDQVAKERVASWLTR